MTFFSLYWAMLCTGRTQPVTGKNAGLQSLVGYVLPWAIWINPMLHRQAHFLKKYIGSLTVSDVIIKWVVNSIKTSPLKGRLFAKLCDDMGVQHRALLF